MSRDGSLENRSPSSRIRARHRVRVSARKSSFRPSVGHIVLLALLALVASVVAATVVPGSAPRQTACVTVDVTIDGSNFQFVTKDITVNQCDTVRWTWTGSFSHSTTSIVGTPDSWDSTLHTSGFVFSYTFVNVGFNRYRCALHGTSDGLGGMVGSVTVLTNGPELSPGSLLVVLPLLLAGTVIVFRHRSGLRPGNDDPL